MHLDVERGRLFDAVSSLLGVRHEASYEGQAAMELEALACADDGDVPHLAFGRDGDVLDPTPLLQALVAARRSGSDRRSLRALPRRAGDGDRGDRDGRQRPPRHATVGLTGGVFQNVLATTLARRALAREGFDVLVHQRVPPNDGGLALGQAAVVAAKLGGRVA